MSKNLIICMLIFALCFSVGIASAGIPEIEANDILRREPGEEFDVVIFVNSHAEADYTVNLTRHPRFQFVEEGSNMNVSGDSALITYTGYDTDSLRFEFPMVAENDTPEGDYNIQYEVYWNGSETGFNYTLVEDQTVKISIGEGGDSSTCSSSALLVLPVLAFGTSLGISKKRKR